MQNRHAWLPFRAARHCRIGFFIALQAVIAAPVAAQITVPDEYNKIIQQHSTLGTLGDNFAGDHIDLSSGHLEIVQTDISLPGNDALPMRVGRRFQAADVYNVGSFGNWTIDLPNVHGTFSRLTGGPWATAYDYNTTDYNRCTHFDVPPFVTYQLATWNPGEYWHGDFLYMPGAGDSELLAAGPHVPNDGKAYPVTTKEGNAVRCVPLAATSVSGSSGEGFEVVTPDGTVWTLNQMVTRNQSTLSRPSYTPTLGVAGNARRDHSPGATMQVATNPTLPRQDVLLFPTQVEDRFHNTITFNWSASNPWQLLNMIASDGRRLDFTYESADSIRIIAIDDGTRIWNYRYDGYGDIESMTLPDGKKWHNHLVELHRINLKPSGTHCGTVNGSTGRTDFTSSAGYYTGSITAPSGATVVFSMDRILLGRAYTPYSCLSLTENASDAYPEEPYLFMTAAVVRKTITGAGLPAGGSTWTYSYGPTNNCWNSSGTVEGVKCNGDVSPTTREVKVTDPVGSVTRYTFGNRYNVNEGMLLKTEYGWNGSSALRTTEIAYADAYAAPYAAYKGYSIRINGDVDITGYLRPQRQVTTTQQGRTFTWQVASDCAGIPYCFDAFARPTKVVKSSSP